MGISQVERGAGGASERGGRNLDAHVREALALPLDRQVLSARGSRAASIAQ